MPKHCAWRMFVNVKQVQLATQFSVVTLFGLLQHREVLLQIILGSPSCAINSLQHFVSVVATPVGTSHFHQLEMLKLAGARHMGTAAQIGKASLAVERHIFIGRNRSDDLGFVVFAQFFEIVDSLVSWHYLTRDGLIFRSQLGHFLFNQTQVVRCERAAIRKIVIKAVFDHGPNSDLCIWIQRLHRIRE